MNTSAGLGPQTQRSRSPPGSRAAARGANCQHWGESRVRGKVNGSGKVRGRRGSGGRAGDVWGRELLRGTLSWWTLVTHLSKLRA